MTGRELIKNLLEMDDLDDEVATRIQLISTVGGGSSRDVDCRILGFEPSDRILHCSWAFEIEYGPTSL